MVSQQESLVNILLPSLFDSQVHPNNIQSEESQSTSSSPRRQSSNSTALKASARYVRAAPSRPFRFQSNQQIFTQNWRESYLQSRRLVRWPRFNPHLHYNLTPAFSSWEILFWDFKRQEYTFQNTAVPSQRFVVPVTAFEVQPVE